MTLRSSLAPFQPPQPLDDEELLAMRRAAWRQHGIAVLRPADIAGPRDEVPGGWTRQAAINAANGLYGRRRENGHG
jgi:hypothetical protein